MTPENIIVWACVILFIIVAIISVLNLVGIIELPNRKHGNYLFMFLVIEIVIVSVGVFARILGTDKITPQFQTGGYTAHQASEVKIIFKPEFLSSPSLNVPDIISNDCLTKITSISKKGFTVEHRNTDGDWCGGGSWVEWKATTAK